MRKKVLILAAIIVIGVVAYTYRAKWPTVAPPQPVPTDKVVAMVNGEPITWKTFNQRYKRFIMRFHLSGSENSESVQELKRSFLNKLIETLLLLQEARVRGLEVSEEELNHEINQLKEDYPKDTLNEALEKIGLQLAEWKEDRKEKLLIDKLIHREIDSIIHVSEDEVQEYYQSNKKEFQQAQMVRARQIVVATEEEASALRSRLLRGEEFEDLAKTYSLSPDAANGGDLGTFSKGQMPEEFDKVVFRYRVGSISKVVSSPYGFHLFKIEDRMSPRTLTLEEVKDQITEKIFRGRQESFFKEWLQSLKEQAKITIYPEILSEMS